MPAPDFITPPQLARFVGLPDAPVLLDVRTEEDFATDLRSLPGAVRRDWRSASTWASEYAGRSVAVVCQRGQKPSQGAAAWLRHAGAQAESLDGGFEAWAAAGATLVRPDRVPPRDAQGRTVWVTRARPKVDRIVCPWLVCRFVDPAAMFLFVTPAEVEAVAERFGATPFDVEGVFWSHRGPLCTFDVMLEEFGIRTGALDRLAAIVRGAGTAQPGLAPDAAGLLAASLGLSRMFKDDLAQLDAGLVLHDAFHRWARDAATEMHIWPAPAPLADSRRVRVPSP